MTAMKYRIAAAWLVGLVGCLTVAEAAPEVSIDTVEVGFMHFYRPGHMVPVFVKLTNTRAASFEGELRAVQTDDDGDRLHWRIPAPLAGKSSQWRHVLICPSPDAMADGSVSISVGSVAGGRYRPVDSASLGRLPASVMPFVPTPLEEGEWVIGVVGDGAGLFGTLNSPTTFKPSEPVRVVVVPTMRIPSMWQGLDMLDVLYWDDPQPGALDDAQQQAVAQWVWRGGHLILGLGAHAAELGSRDSVLGALVPVTVMGTGMGVRSLAPLHRALGGLGGAGAGTVVRVAPRSGAHVLARDYDQGLPLLCRWAKGAGSVTVVSVTLRGARLADAQPGYRAARLARLAGLGQGPGDPAMWSGGVPVTSGLGGYLDSTDVGGTIVAIVILMCLAYALLAGPGTWLYVRARNQRHLSWWAFAAVVLVATLASVLLSLFGIRNESIRSAMVLDLSAGSNLGVLQGHFGMYIPAHRSPVLNVGADPAASLVPMIDPAGSLFGGYPDTKSYQVDLTDPTRLKVPVRRTIKRFALSWRGDIGHNVDGSVHVTRSTDPATKVDHATGTITNNLPVALTHAILIYASPDGGRQIAQATLGSIDAGQTVRFGTIGAAGSAQRECPVRSLQDFHKNLAGTLGLRGPGALGRPEFHERIWMLSTMSQYEQPSRGDVRATAQRLCFARLDRMDQIHPGQALLIARAEGYVPAPIRIDGDEVDTGGATVVRVLIPVAESPPPAATGQTTQ